MVVVSSGKPVEENGKQDNNKDENTADEVSESVSETAVHEENGEVAEQSSQIKEGSADGE
jgi:hypothetical protein